MLQTKGFLPPAYMVPVRAGLAIYNGGEQAENAPNLSKGERVCFVPYLIRGLGFPIHPFLRGLLEFYGLQLHHLTPASILHVAGFVALSKLFLGIEAHFTLWKRLLCLVPYLIRGLGFPIHLFLRGLLEFYGLQLHHLTPASVLHIAGFVALCELFLGVEAHFSAKWGSTPRNSSQRAT